MQKDGFGLPKPLDDLPRSRSGRLPQWVVDEAQGRPLQHAVPFRADLQPHNMQGPGKRGWKTRVFWTFVVASVLVGAAWLQATDRVPTPKDQPPVQAADRPSPSREAAKHPLGSPIRVPEHSSAYGFVAHQTGSRAPVAYDPCRPIHYVTRAKGEPLGGRDLITSAVARISQVTGLQFIDDGTTSEGPSRQRAPFQRKRYGDRWAPVLFAWVAADENPDVAAQVAGEGGSQPEVDLKGHALYVTGQVELDSQQFTEILARPHGAAEARVIILHELGHVVGLAHVADKTQVMYPAAQPGVTDFGVGDLNGLIALGRGACLPDL